MTYRFRHKILGPMLVAWLVILVAGVAFRTLVWDRLATSFNESIDAAMVSSALDRLYSSLLDAKAGERGYLLTGNESFLEPFKNASASLTENFGTLAPLAAKDATMQGDLLELRGLAELTLAEARDSIKLRREKGLTAVTEFANTDKDGPNLDRIRRLVAQMDQKQLDVISTAAQTTLGRVTKAQLMGLFTGFLGIGAGLFALYLVRVGSAQEKAQKELLEEKKRAEETVVEKSAFLANISHEIRTPMNAILGFGELLEGEALTPGQAQYVKSIRQSGQSLLQLINDVLDLSKLEAGKLEIRHEPTDLREICNFLQTMFGQQAAAKSLQLQFETTGLPHALLLDRLRLRQVLVNLVGNAVKFTPQGRVWLRGEWSPAARDSSRGTLSLYVEDTGIGISPGKQAEIFKPFVQSKSSGAQENEGTGLGLHIVQRLVQIMGGTIGVESAPGKGASFHLRFPDVSVSARLPVSDSDELDGAVDFNDFAPATLLVVDDIETNRELIAGIFKGTHHQIKLARDGREALAILAKSRPDLVLLDIRMPVMDGHQVLAEIRRLPGMELLPVIAVTASSQAGDEPGELQSQFNGYVRKPFTWRALYKELSQFLPKASQSTAGHKVHAVSAATPVAGCTARKAGDWEAMVAELHLLQASSWAGLRESIAINETKAFAMKLHTLAHPNECRPLATYAESLATHAQNYAVGDLEKLLAEYPALLQAIEQFQPKDPHG